MSVRADREQKAIRKEWRAAAVAKRTPCLCLARVSLDDLLVSIRAEHFPEVVRAVSCTFVPRGMLAWVEFADTGPAHIYIHEVLNHPEPPAVVFSLILKHELLHLRIPPREVDGKVKYHPPEFWEAERRVAPEGAEAWEWLWGDLWPYLRRNGEEEGIRVLRTWKRHVWGERRAWLDAHGRLRVAPDRSEGW